MSLQSLDLNLLKVFDAIYRARNLTEVARQVHLTQPAVSHALRRLRTSLGDPLFVRTVHGLEPTPRSEEMIEPIRHALRLIEDSVSNSGRFEPSSCTREFRLMLSDVGELVFLPRLLQHLRGHAPGATAVVVQAPRTQYEALLRDKFADITVGHLPELPQTLKRRLLFRDEFVVLRAHDAARSTRRLTVSRYAQAPHVDVDPPGTVHNAVDQVTHSLGFQRRVVLRVPHFFAVPSILLQTDLMVTVPRSVVRNIRKPEDFLVTAVPFKLPPLEVAMYWHARQDADPAHRWLRQTMIDLFSERRLHRDAPDGR